MYEKYTMSPHYKLISGVLFKQHIKGNCRINYRALHTWRH